jgi:hypothetical protein
MKALRHFSGRDYGDKKRSGTVSWTNGSKIRPLNLESNESDPCKEEFKRKAVWKLFEKVSTF